jgi:hypothetical protein
MRNRSLTLTFCALVAVAVTGLSAPAFAQETTPTPPPTETAPPAHHRAASGGGNASGLGLGASAYLSGPLGPEVTYDFGMFHLAGLLAFNRPDNGPAPSTTEIQFGVSGWYHLHMGASSDFSLGGGIAYAHNSANNGSSAIALEPGALVRAFVTPNVAVHARMGVVMAFDNATPINEHLALTAQTMFLFGFTYFFGG